MYGSIQYTVAGLRLQINWQPYMIKLKKEYPYSAYMSQEEPCDVNVMIRPASQLMRRNTDPVFASSRNRAYYEYGKIYRYRGIFLNVDEENWLGCQVVDPLEENVIQVYLPCRQKAITEGSLFAAMGLDYLLSYRGKVVLHAAYIQCLGQAVLFTAPSGTGKSTQAELWRQNRPGTRIVNGDRAVFSVEDERTMAHGFPFCGSSGISHNISCPLKAIVVLRQGKKNHLVRLVGAQAATILLSECMVPLWDRIATQRVMDTVTQVVEQCPIYLYHCLPDASAVEHLYHVIYEGGKPDE